VSVARREWDYVIVGAGIIGLQVAHYLRKSEPAASILILERGRVGGGASHHSVGLHLPYGRTSARRALSEISHRENDRRFAGQPHPLRSDVAFTGVVSSENAAAQLAAFHVAPKLNADTGSAFGSVAAFARIGQQTVLTVEECHYTDVGGLCRLLAAQLRREEQVEIWEGAAVAQLDDSNSGVTAELSYGEVVRSRQLILAIGPWVRHSPFDRLTGELNVRVKKVAALQLNRLPERHDAAIFLLDEDAFLLPMYAAGYWVFSYTSTTWDVSPNSVPPLTRADRLEALEVLSRYFPDLVGVCNGGRAFCDAYTTEPAPIVRRLTDHPQIIFAGAAGGSGYRLSPGIAIRVADLAASGR
jgi:glycine/D-amino acid oxidase-like deaminating enzyme